MLSHDRAYRVSPSDINHETDKSSTAWPVSINN